MYKLYPAMVALQEEMKDSVTGSGAYAKYLGETQNSIKPRSIF